VTGLHDLDIYIQSQLLYSALNLALGVLRPGGKFVAKIFRDRDVDLLYSQLRTVFERVSVAKPRSSRASSLEAFIVCEGFIPPAIHNSPLSMDALKNPIFGGAAIPQSVSTDGNIAAEVPDDEVYTAKTVKTTASTASQQDNQTRLLHEASGDSTTPEPLFNNPQKFAAENRWIPSFIACGDLSAWDSDASYSLPPDHVSLDPVQPPMAPPYRRALELRKEKGGAYGKTKLGTTGRA
jgi:tRNA (cytidine32/guanosine34-2'-O)-methyltransferase